MRTGHERFVTDKDGKRVAVLLDVDEYVGLLQKLEELEALKLPGPSFQALSRGVDSSYPYRLYSDTTGRADAWTQLVCCATS